MALDTDMRGISLVGLPAFDESGSGAILLTFADAEIGITPTKGSSCHVVSTDMLWGEPMTFQGVRGPALTLSEPVAGTVRVAPTYTGVFNNGVARTSIVALSILYSYDGYPRDIDAKDNRTGKTVTIDQNRVSWDGQSQNFDIVTGQASGTRVYVTVWGLTRMGTSEPAHASLEIA